LLELVLWRSRRQAIAVDTAEQPRKKRRAANDPSRLRQKLRSPDTGTQRTALQLVPFLIHSSLFSDDEAWDILSFLTSLITDKRTSVASWAMIACAR
jgi:ataxia telangiectasia mutated family protein